MKPSVIFVILMFASFAHASNKCAEWAKISALDWAKEVLESDIEADKQIGDKPMSIELKTPILRAKSKNPQGVFEAYTLDWTLKFKSKNWNYSGLYFFDENCHRMKSAEIEAGKTAEAAVAEKNSRK